MEKSVGINTSNADEYVAAFVASENAEGNSRLIQIVSLTSGKIPEAIGSYTRNVNSNDSLDVTTISGNISIGDNCFFSCYVSHTETNGECFITPLLCDNTGDVIGLLNSKKSEVTAKITKSGNYLTSCLSWDIRDTGSWKIFPHVSGLSENNSISMWAFTF